MASEVNWDSMEALILCGGKGTRLKPLTNKPFVLYAMEQVKEAGITDIAIIRSPETGELIKQAVGDGSEWNAKVSYIPQSKPAEVETPGITLSGRP